MKIAILDDYQNVALRRGGHPLLGEETCSRKIRRTSLPF
jgi:hypothetical protein